jgi:nucleotidyltransferase AbiEii toxin of type IV toxin-antitoxin system
VTNAEREGSLERVEEPGGGPRFVLKGGVAIELRLRAGARATQDVDMVFRGPDAELLDALDAAFTEPYRDFAFERGAPVDRGPHATGFDVRLAYQSRAWGTVRLEISGPDVSGEEVELVPAISLEDFQLTGPTEIACLPLRFQIAQKIHAVTERPTDRENRRFRDLVDLLILRDLVADLGSLRVACEATFEHRATHTWPPQLDIPDASWRDGYELLASEVGVDVADVETAATEVRAFVAAIAVA